MSESLADLFVVLRAETSPFVAAMTEASNAAEAAAARIVESVARINASMAEVGASTEGMAAKVTAAEREAATATEATAAKVKAADEQIIVANDSMSAAMKTTIAELNAQYSEMGLKAGASAEEIARADERIAAGWVKTAESVKVSTDSIAASMDHMAAQAKLAGLEIEAQDVKTAAATETMAAKVDAGNGVMAKAFSKTGVGIVALSAGIAFESIKMAGNFQAKTDVFTTTAGEDIKNMGMIRQGMLNLSTETGTDAEHMVTAMYKVESSHIHGADALNVLKAAAQGAKIENADLTKVADALTTTMTDFHFKVGDAALVMSKLVAVTGGGKLTMEEMAGSLHSVDQVASVAGLSLDQTGGALATLTLHGMSADQATQNLRNAIQNLLAPNQVATKEMAGLDINALDLSSHLGERGLTGTYKILTTAIADHTKNGHVVLDLMNNSALAAGKANRELEALPPTVRDVAKSYADGTMSSKDFTKYISEQGVAMKSQLTTFKTAEERAHGFSDALKNGNADVTTFVDVLKRSTGGTTGLGVALGLTGENAAAFDDNIASIANAAPEADGAVKGWEETQGRFNQKMDEAWQGLKNFGMEIGTTLLPYATAAAGAFADFSFWLQQNQGAAQTLAFILAGVLAAAIVAIGVKLTKAIAGPFVDLAKLGGRFLAWIGEKVFGFDRAATAAEKEALREKEAAQQTATAMSENTVKMTESIDKLTAALQRPAVAAEEATKRMSEAEKQALFAAQDAVTQEESIVARYERIYAEKAAAAEQAATRIAGAETRTAEAASVAATDITAADGRASAAIEREAVVTVESSTKIVTAYTEAAAGAEAASLRIVAADAKAGTAGAEAGAVGAAGAAGGAGRKGGGLSGAAAGLGGLGIGMVASQAGSSLYGAIGTPITEAKDPKSVGAIVSDMADTQAKLDSFDISGIVNKLKTFSAMTESTTGAVGTMRFKIGDHLGQMNSDGAAKMAAFTAVLSAGPLKGSAAATSAVGTMRFNIADHLGKVNADGATKMAAFATVLASGTLKGSASATSAVGTMKFNIADHLSKVSADGSTKMAAFAAALASGSLKGSVAVGANTTTARDTANRNLGSMSDQAATKMAEWSAHINTHLAAGSATVGTETGKMVSTSGTAMGNIVQSGVDGFTRFNTAITDGVTKGSGEVGTFGPKSVSAMGNTNSVLYPAGQGFMQGLQDGINSMWAGIQSFVGGIKNWIAANKGPIEVDRQLLVPHGAAIMAGLHEGLVTGHEQVKSLVSSIAADISGQFGIPKSMALGTSVTGGVSIASALAATSQASRGSNGSSGGGQTVHVTVNVAGSVLAEQDLVRTVQQGLTQHGMRNNGNATDYSGFR